MCVSDHLVCLSCVPYMCSSYFLICSSCVNHLGSFSGNGTYYQISSISTHIRNLTLVLKCMANYNFSALQLHDRFSRHMMIT